MTIARKTYLFVAALFVFLVATPPVMAQDDDEGDVVCWWCFEVQGDHMFVHGGEGCVSGINGTDHENMHCSRCGGTSECHVDRHDPGSCHIACGPAGDAMAALTEIQEALEGDDMTVVASALFRQRTGVYVEFLPEEGRIDLVLPCDPTKAFRTLPVLPEARAKLEVQLRAHSTATEI